MQTINALRPQPVAIAAVMCPTCARLISFARPVRAAQVRCPSLLCRARIAVHGGFGR